MPTTYAIPDGRTVMAATTYTGTGATQTINNSANGVSFQPDFVWTKSRSAATDHKLTDSVRGATKALSTNNVSTEATDTTGLTAFSSAGFTLGANTTYNNNAATYVAWQWKASGSTSSNTSGSITSTVSVNATAGFSVVTYTGNFTAGATVGHGLGVAPSMILVKTRTQASVDWITYHVSMGATKGLYMDTGAATTSAIFWNNTSPTSSVITLGGGAQSNGNAQNMVAYCFAAVAGYSAFGSYTGNGSADGPFVFTNFRPRWVMIKRTDANENWQMYDTSRNTSNVVGEYLLANSSGAGATITVLDFLSNGFKIRVDGTNPGVNTSGGTYIYAAFAETAFKFANAR